MSINYLYKYKNEIKLKLNMKRIYNYNTGILESVKDSNSKNKLYEGARLSTFDKILEASGTQIRSDEQLYEIIDDARNGAVTYILQSRGNGVVKALVNACNEECVVLSGRELAYSNPDRVFVSDDTLYIINEFAFIRDLDIINHILELTFEEGLNVIFVSNIDSTNNEYIIDKLDGNCVFYVYSPVIRGDEMDESVSTVRESVTDKFARYRRLYEGDDDNEDDNTSNDDAFANLDNNDNADDNADNTDADEEPKKDDSEDDDEVVPLTAVVLTVKKGTEDACKDELIDAGIAEDAIEILDDDKENEAEDETVEIKIDAKYYDELESYLKDVKGINLAEKLGGEVIKDEDGDDSEKDNEDGDNEDETNTEDNKDDDNKSDDKSKDNFDDVFGDLFDEPEK